MNPSLPFRRAVVLPRVAILPRVAFLPRAALLATLLLFLGLTVLSRAQSAGTFSEPPFNGMQITYSISAVTVSNTVDQGGFTTSRSLSGTLGSGTLRVSGNARMDNGFYADLRVNVQSGAATDSFAIRIPVGESSDFDVSIVIPPTALGASVSISMAGTYNAGGRGLRVDGLFTRSDETAYRLSMLPLHPHHPLDFQFVLHRRAMGESEWTPAAGEELLLDVFGDPQVEHNRYAISRLVFAKVENANFPVHALHGRAANEVVDNTPLRLVTDARGRVRLNLLIDYRKIAKFGGARAGTVNPSRQSTLDVPVLCRFEKDGETKAELLGTAFINAQAVITYISVLPPDRFTNFGKRFPRSSRALEDFATDPGTIEDGQRIYRENRVTVIPEGSTLPRPVGPGRLLFRGDSVRINAENLPSPPSGGRSGEIWVRMEFFDGTRAQFGVKGNYGTASFDLKVSAEAAGFLSERFDYTVVRVLCKEGVEALVQKLIPVYGYIDGAKDAYDLIAWAGGYGPQFMVLNSEILALHNSAGNLLIAAREGDPVLHNLHTPTAGIPILPGQTAGIQAGAAPVLGDTPLSSKYLMETYFAEFTEEVEEVFLFSTYETSSAIQNLPTQPTRFVLDQPHKLTYLETMHWNNGTGRDGSGQSLAVRAEDGTSYGPWPVVSVADSGSGVDDVYWVCMPDAELPSGVYTVEDSHAASWSRNAASDQAGFAVAFGLPRAHPTPPPTDWTGAMLQSTMDLSAPWQEEPDSLLRFFENGALSATSLRAPSADQRYFRMRRPAGGGVSVWDSMTLDADGRPSFFANQ